MSILGVLLTILVIVGGFISSQLSSLHSDINTLTVSATESRTKQAEQIHELQDKVLKLETDQKDEKRDQTAYNYDLSKSLTVIKTTLENGKAKK